MTSIITQHTTPHLSLNHPILNIGKTNLKVEPAKGNKMQVVELAAVISRDA